MREYLAPPITKVGGTKKKVGFGVITSLAQSHRVISRVK